ncbi:hypothetical protein BWI75_14055 [Gloeocapsopsis sp. AAB1 = 1H9]|uniref:Uncharacterized protein n=1 Tax=Gloeocapsopsis dulcis AAB1 = 1H9 TaxID=1433147 RepID=A0A6N8FXR9_9CHRO|nr:hypothetical protein [Gloeocapsopsis dulcis AAB1 = 1H9]
MQWLAQQGDASTVINQLVNQARDSQECNIAEEELAISREQLATLQQQLKVETLKGEVYYYQQLKYEDQLEISNEQIRALKEQIIDSKQKSKSYCKQLEQVIGSLRDLLSQVEFSKKNNSLSEAMSKY